MRYDQVRVRGDGRDSDKPEDRQKEESVGEGVESGEQRDLSNSDELKTDEERRRLTETEERRKES